MMKEKANQEMEKASQTMFSHKLHRILPFKPNNNRLIILLQPQVQGMVLFLLLKLTQHVDPTCARSVKTAPVTDMSLFYGARLLEAAAAKEP